MRASALLLAALLLPLPLGEGRGEGPPGSSYYRPQASTQATIPHEREPLKLAPKSGPSRSGLVRPVAPSASGALGTVAGSLGIVLGLFFVLVWFSRRFSPANGGQLPKEAVETLGRAPFSSKQQLQLLRVGNKLLLVVHSPAGV